MKRHLFFIVLSALSLWILWHVTYYAVVGYIVLAAYK